MIISTVKNYIKYFKMKERKKRYGTRNGDVTYYVIRRDAENAGINSYFITNLGHIVWGLKHGWIPIVDMKNYSNAYLKNNELGEKMRGNIILTSRQNVMFHLKKFIRVKTLF